MDNKTLVIKPATRKDIKQFYGDKMRDSCRAWSAFYQGELVCIAGVVITSNIMLVFMEVRSNKEVPKMTIWRGTRDIWSKIQGLGYNVLYAVADPKHTTAPAYLSRLGFSNIKGNIYRWQIQSQQPLQ